MKKGVGSTFLHYGVRQLKTKKTTKACHPPATVT